MHEIKTLAASRRLTPVTCHCLLERGILLNSDTLCILTRCKSTTKSKTTNFIDSRPTTKMTLCGMDPLERRIETTSMGYVEGYARAVDHLSGICGPATILGRTILCIQTPFTIAPPPDIKVAIVGRLKNDAFEHGARLISPLIGHNTLHLKLCRHGEERHASDRELEGCERRKTAKGLCPRLTL